MTCLSPIRAFPQFRHLVDVVALPFLGKHDNVKHHQRLNLAYLSTALFIPWSLSFIDGKWVKQHVTH